MHESYGGSFYIGSKIFNSVDNNVLVFGVTFKKWENELKYIGTKLLYTEFTSSNKYLDKHVMRT